MRRAAIWFVRVLSVLIALPVLLLLAANTDPGRHAIEQLVPQVTGDQVRIVGLAGRFPDALRAQQLQLRDPHGTYLSIDDVTFDWSPLQLVHRQLVVDQLAAAQVALQRLPQSGSSSSSSSSLPVQIIVRALHIARLEVAAPVAGVAVALAVDAAGELDTLSTGSAQITAQQLGGDGHYQINATINDADLHATIAANEPPHGLLSGLAGLPELGALAIDAQLSGPRSAVATQLTISAGPLHASAHGQVDLQHDAADVTIAATASAMTPRPDISWQSITLNAHAQGSFTQPNVSGQLRIEQLTAAGASASTLTADVTGNAGQARLHAELSALRVPGTAPELLADTPLLLDASVQLDAPDRPVHFSLRHKLITADGTAQTAGALAAQVALNLPDLAPFAVVAGTELHGNLALTLHGALQGATTQVSTDGTLALTDGPPLVGDAVKFSASATLQGQDVTLSHLQLDSRDAAFTATGSLAGSVVNLDWTLALANLAALQPTLSGDARASGHVGGTRDNLAATTDLSGTIGAPGIAPGPLSARLEVHNLPQAPSGTLSAQGTLLGAPLQLAIAADRQDGEIHVAIDHADWKSAHAEGALQLTPPAVLPTGSLTFRMQQLDDIAPLLGQRIVGSVNATLTADAKLAHLATELRGVALPGVASASNVVLNATVDQSGKPPSVDATLTIDGAAAGGVGGSATLRAQGTTDALALNLDANLPSLAGAAAKIGASGRLNASAREFDLATLQATWRQQTLHLLAPVRIAFTNGIMLDRLRLGLQQAVLEASGRVSPTLDLTASLRNLPADIAAVVAPSVAVDGAISATARVTGTSAQPAGTIRVTAKGLRMRSGPGRSVPAADVDAVAKLAGTMAQLDIHLTAGASRLNIVGAAPLSPSGALNLHTTGNLDLAVLNPILAANGRRASGKLAVNVTVGGTIAAPAISGTAQLSNGDVQDYTVGAHLTDITAQLEGAGGTLRLQANAKAGPGTLSASGSIGVLSPGIPLDLTLTARNAQPLASDLITALIDADLTLRGEAAGQLAAGGTLHVRRAEIRVPEKLPGSLATIPVRVAGVPPPPPPPPGPDVTLNLTLEAPGQIFVRGRGLDVELGGTIHLKGTAANPQPDGGFELRRGTLSIAGQTLTFTQGTISFNGAGLVDPALDLIISTISNNVTATLTVGGTARKPTITLTSVPDLPQDEVLAELLFKRRVSSLGPFELAEIASALASLTGAPSIDNPLASIRQGLGLDRLGVGTGASGAPTLEAGRYLAPGIYLGAKQAVSGGGSQATVQIDIAKGLKLEATTGAGSSNSATGAGGNSNGSSVGVTYQFDY